MAAAATAAAHTPPPHHRHPLPGELFAYGGLSCVFAAVVTNPLDVAKTQLQVQGELSGHGGAAAAAATGARPAGMFGALASLLRAEGPKALMRGVAPSMLREATYSTVRYGAYDPIKARLQAAFGGRYSGTHARQAATAASKGANETQAMPMSLKVVAGGVAGAVGAAGATPSDLIKVRAQAAAAGGAPSPGVVETALRIYRSEGGLRALYRGVGPTTLRAAMLTATQLPTYDHCKYQRFFPCESRLLHLACSMVAGVACATTVAPVDLVKSRYMNQPVDAAGRGLRYRGMADCLLQSARSEGALALWKGWAPSCARLGPHTCISLLIFENLRQAAGLSPV